jgi:hypothetical protein
MDSWNLWQCLVRDLRACAIKKFLRLSAQRRMGYVKVSVLLLLSEFALRLWPIHPLLQFLQKRWMLAPISSSRTPEPQALDRLTQLVELADRHGLFRPSCLRQTLVVAWLLGGQGVATSLRIGVTKADGQLRAHAWLEPQASDTFLVALP